MRVQLIIGLIERVLGSWNPEDPFSQTDADTVPGGSNPLPVSVLRARRGFLASAVPDSDSNDELDEQVALDCGIPPSSAQDGVEQRNQGNRTGALEAVGYKARFHGRYAGCSSIDRPFELIGNGGCCEQVHTLSTEVSHRCREGYSQTTLDECVGWESQLCECDSRMGRHPFIGCVASRQ